jgi:hypothetical protein
LPLLLPSVWLDAGWQVCPQVQVATLHVNVNASGMVQYASHARAQPKLLTTIIIIIVTAIDKAFVIT